jgi:hypothetical protein
MNAFRGMLLALLLGGAVCADERPEKGKDPAEAPAGAEVSGTVTLNGKPLPAGWICFHGKAGKEVRIAFADGKYQLKNAPTGEIKITIDTDSIRAMAEVLRDRWQALETRASLLKAAKKEDAELAKQIEETKRRVKVTFEKFVKIPAKYGQKETTPLTLSVKKGSQNADIKLEN